MGSDERKKRNRLGIFKEREAGGKRRDWANAPPPWKLAEVQENGESQTRFKNVRSLFGLAL